MEKQRAEYQDKWVPPDTASAAWCNPWSFGTSTTFQISTRSRQPTPLSAAAAATTTITAATATTTEVRTPRKNAQQSRERLAHLRKSPRLLAKGATGRTTRRTPSKKNNASAATTTAPSAGTSKDTFKQQLKAVIIKVLSDQKIGTKDPLFRTCANKLSVICMALLKDSRTVVTPRQMYQVAKSQAKQVLQFVKPWKLKTSDNDDSSNNNQKRKVSCVATTYAIPAFSQFVAGFYVTFSRGGSIIIKGGRCKKYTHCTLNCALCVAAHCCTRYFLFDGLLKLENTELIIKSECRLDLCCYTPQLRERVDVNSWKVARASQGTQRKKKW